MTVAAGTSTAIERRLALLAVGLAAILPSAVVGGEHILCPIRRATGRPCPSCGLTRSWRAALRGRPRESFAHHPLGPAALAVAVAYGVGLDERPGLVREALRQPAIGAATTALWLGVWLIRVRRARYASDARCTAAPGPGTGGPRRSTRTRIS
jgi:uncharacterized protein DUF2752